MRMIRRGISCLIILLLTNAAVLWNTLTPSTPVGLLGLLVLAAGYVAVNIAPAAGGDLPRKLKTLRNGCELLLLTGLCTVVQMAVYIYLWQVSAPELSVGVWAANAIVGFGLLAGLLANGLIRLSFSSSQLTMVNRIFIIFLWWVPVVNIVAFIIVYGKARREYAFNTAKIRRNRERKTQRVCQTKYPLLMVHGIFFRDWKLFNYWGRIPEELEENGATIFYGRQQSSSSVEDCAEELKARILEIVEQENCGKVNIIAHSKGGLDSRYAVSCLGMDKYVASLTTINTPHRGCRFAGKALDNIPDNLVSGISKQYDAIFSKLGDDQPDFFTGVSELTDEKCAELNEQMPDRAGVLYQSVGSRMRGAGSAGFPLNLGYGIVKAVDGPNDGLVAVESMPWGDFTMLEPVGKQGISHGDVIDLTRKDVEGFDVCEFYVDLVEGLKVRGC